MTRPSVTSVHTAIKAALNAAGVYAVDGPADDLPSDGGFAGRRRCCGRPPAFTPTPAFRVRLRVALIGCS